jgi:hypothetical protein
MGEGENLEWACSQCEFKKFDHLQIYTRKIMEIRHLKNAGYPFRANDLLLEDWQDLGTLEEAMKDITKMQPRPVYLVKMKS